MLYKFSWNVTWCSQNWQIIIRLSVIHTAGWFRLSVFISKDPRQHSNVYIFKILEETIGCYDLFTLTFLSNTIEIHIKSELKLLSMHVRLQNPIQNVLHSRLISIKLKSLILYWFHFTETIIIIVVRNSLVIDAAAILDFFLLSACCKSFQWISITYYKFKTTNHVIFSTFILSTLHRLNFSFFNRSSFSFLYHWTRTVLKFLFYYRLSSRTLKCQCFRISRGNLNNEWIELWIHTIINMERSGSFWIEDNNMHRECTFNISDIFNAQCSVFGVEYCIYLLSKVIRFLFRPFNSENNND